NPQLGTDERGIGDRTRSARGGELRPDDTRADLANAIDGDGSRHQEGLIESGPRLAYAGRQKAPAAHKHHWLPGLRRIDLARGQAQLPERLSDGIRTAAGQVRRLSPQDLLDAGIHAG